MCQESWQQELERVIMNTILQPSGSVELDSLTKTVVGEGWSVLREGREDVATVTEAAAVTPSWCHQFTASQ